MNRLFRKRASGPELSPETLRRVDILFLPEDRELAKALLHEQCGANLPFQEKADPNQLERFRFAALKYSDGSLLLLESAVKLAQLDWRDLLMATGFAHDVEAHRRWEPKPAGEPAEIDPPLLVAAIHDRLAAALVPLGFERRGDEWRRASEVPQTLRLQTGLTSRTDVRFFLNVTLDAKPLGVMLHLPRLPAQMEELSEQGYIFRAGDSVEPLYLAIMRDVNRYCEPWFQRFISASEVQRGFEDGTFKPHVRIQDQPLVLVF
jgi:hypothetical protein